MTIGIRPEHCDVVTDGRADIEVSIDLAEHLGGETFFYCSAPGIAELTAQEAGELMRARGDKLKLRFRRDQLHLFDAEGRALSHGAAAAVAS